MPERISSTATAERPDTDPTAWDAELLDIDYSDNTSSHEPKLGRTPEQVLESLEDLTNRIADKEILGRSVRFKHDISEKAASARTRSDKLLASVRNGVEWPDRQVAAWHTRRAEASLQRKQNRVESKGIKGQFHDWRKDVAQSKIDDLRGQDSADDEPTTSNRLEQVHQSKIDKKVAKQQAKIDKHQGAIDTRKSTRQARVDAYEAGKVTRRRDEYTELTDRAGQRSSGSERRATERLAEVERARTEAIGRKEAALGRKALRVELRQAGATRSESKKVIEKMQSDTDGEAVRALGRKLFEGQRADLAHQSSRAETNQAKESFARDDRLLARAETASQQLPGLIESGASRQQQLSQELEYLDTRADELSQAHGESSPQLAELEKYRQTVEDQLYDSQQQLAQLQHQQQILPAKIQKLRRQTQEGLARYEQSAAESKDRRQQAEAIRQSLSDDARAALGFIQDPITTNRKQEKN